MIIDGCWFCKSKETDNNNKYIAHVDSHFSLGSTAQPKSLVISQVLADFFSLRDNSANPDISRIFFSHPYFFKLQIGGLVINGKRIFVFSEIVSRRNGCRQLLPKTEVLSKAQYTLATKLNSTRSTLLKVDCCGNWQHIGNKVDCCRTTFNNVNSTAFRGRLCCQCVRGQRHTVDFVDFQQS